LTSETLRKEEAVPRDKELESLEIELLVEAVYRHYGYDFREYAPASFRRRVTAFAHAEGLASVSGLQERVLHDPACFQRFLHALSVNVTAFFRDPEFFLAFRRLVMPILRTYPFLRIWHAGCSTGEEVYSMAILLHEEGLYDRCRIYATDVNAQALRQAEERIYPLREIQQHSRNYSEAGGKRALADYYTAGYGGALFAAWLRENILFAPHNLAQDSVFNEFHVILCRNVMIYFKHSLQQRVHVLLYDSLVPFGILGIGSKESLRLTPHEKDYAPLEAGSRLYRRIG